MKDAVKKDEIDAIMGDIEDAVNEKKLILSRRLRKMLSRRVRKILSWVKLQKYSSPKGQRSKQEGPL